MKNYFSLPIVVFILFFLLSSSYALPCDKLRRKHMTALRMGTYVAQCKADGSWEPKQCHGSTGHCWCVDSEGKRLGSAVPPGSNVILECKRGENGN